MKHILAAILAISAFAANATSFPNSASEAYALQNSAEWNSLSSGQQADVIGTYGTVDKSQHLDGVHQEPVTPHLDAPHHEPIVHQTATAHVVHQQTLTPEEKPSGETTQPERPSVVDKRGASARPDIRVVVHEVAHNTETKTVVESQQRLILQPVNVENRYNDSGVRSSIQTNSKRLSTVSSRVDRNEQRLAKQSADIENNSRNIKRVGASAAAIGNLHFNRSESGFALSLGEYRGESAIAGGLQFNVSELSAITVQVSLDGAGSSESVGYHQSW